MRSEQTQEQSLYSYSSLRQRGASLLSKSDDWPIRLFLFALLFFGERTLFAQNPIAGNQGFQILSEGDFTFTGYTHVHGSLGIGGNLILNDNSTLAEICMDGVSSYVFPGDGATTTGLLVKGGVTWTAGGAKVMGGQNMHIGSSTGCTESDNGVNMATQVLPTGASYNNAKRIEGTLDQTPSPAVFQTVGFDFTTLFTTYRATSEGLATCTNTVQLQNSSGVDIPGNNVTSAQNVQISALANGINHLDLTQTSLNNITELKFNSGASPNASKLLVITVPLTSNFVWNNANMPGMGGSVNAGYILWNFSGTTTYNLTINTASLIIGTIFAPNHNLIKTGTGDIDGNLIAKTMVLGLGEIHLYPFNGSVATCCSPMTTAGTIGTAQSGCLPSFDPAILTENIAPTGGSGTLEYQWQSSLNNSTWSDISGATAQIYDPTAISATTYYRRGVKRNGCASYIYSNSVVVTLNSLPTAAIAGTNTLCVGASTTLTASGGGTYLWSTGATTAGITVAPASDATYMVTVTNANGCTATASRVVTVNTLPVSSISGTNIICAGASTTLTASGGSTYLWNTGATTAGITVTPASTTAYTVTVTNAGGCTSTATRTVNINTTPVAAISGTNVLCNGVSTTLTASGGGTYLWNIGATSAGISVSPTTTTTYTVTVTNVNGCSATASRTVTVNANPTANISGTNTICAGASTMLTVIGGSTYIWNTGSTSAAIVVTPASTTTYSVTVTNANGCTAVASRVVTVNSIPTASISGTNTICAGANTTLLANGGSTYAWSNGSSSANITVTPASNTTYTVTVTNASACTATASQLVTVNPSPTAVISGTTILCTGGSTILTASGGNYTWNTGATTAAITVTPASTTAYTVTVSNASSCTATAASTVTIVADPAISSQPNSATICSGGTQILSVTATGGTPSLTYQWQSSPNNSTWTNIAGATSNSYTTAVLTATTYYKVIVSAAGIDCGSVTSSVATITVVPDPAISTQPVGFTECVSGNLPLSLIATGGTPSLNYQWQSSPNNSTWSDVLSGGTFATYTPSSLSAGTTYYRCAISASGNGCVSVTSSTATVVIIADPAISSQPTGATICTGGTHSMSVSATGGSPSLTYLWQSSTDNSTFTNIAGATSTSYATPVLTSTTYYRVIVSASDNGCGSVTSNSAAVTVVADPTITTQPANTSICTGNTTSFSVVATGGTPSLTYQWQTSTMAAPATWTNISGATSSNYTTPVLVASANYRCIVSASGNGCGTATSNSATATVSNPPVISVQPASATICTGGVLNLSVTASGSPTYQWQSSPNNSTWTNITGATASTYTTPALSTLTYYRAVLSVGACVVNSNAASATIVADPLITVQPIGAALCISGTHIMSVSATGGTPSLTYQWQSSPNNTTWTNISGATSTTYSTPIITTTTYYRVNVGAGGNGCTTVTSSTANVTVSNCENCSDGIDNDGDGQPDCFDSDCSCYAPVICDQAMFQTYELQNYVSGVGSNGDYVFNELTGNPIGMNFLKNLMSLGLTQKMNALGYNPIDHFFYFTSSQSPYNLYRMNADYQIQNLGPITGIHSSQTYLYAGDFDAAGNYYIIGQPSNQSLSQRMYKINLTTRVATQVLDFGGWLHIVDVSFNPIDGKFYGWNGLVHKLTKIDPTNWTFTNIGPVNTLFDGMAATSFSPQGKLIGYADYESIGSTGTYETLVSIDPSTGIVTQIGFGPTTNFADGCSCPYRVELVKTGPATAQSNSTITYTFTIYNRSGVTLNNLAFRDTLPSGFAFASNAKNKTGGINVSGTADGLQIAALTLGSVSPGVSSFTLDVAIPACVTSSGVTLTNQAYLSNIQAMLPFHTNIVKSDDINTEIFPDPTVTQITCVEICFNGTDDDGDGLVDCADSDCTTTSYATAVTSQTGVTNPTNATGATNATFAQFYDTNDQITLDFGTTIPAGKTIGIIWRKNTSSGSSATMTVQLSPNNTTYTAVTGSPFSVSSTSWATLNITTTVSTRYIRITNQTSNDLDLDAVRYILCSVEICNNGIDDDSDGLTDCAESSCSAPTGNAGPDQIICAGGSAILTATATGVSGPYTYNWSNSLGSGASKVVAPTTTTTYTVSVTTANSCASTDQVTVTVVSDPTITAQPTAISECVGGTQALSVTATGGTPSLTYQWQSSTDNITFADISGATLATYTPPATVAGTIYYQVAISASGNGCGVATSTPVAVTVAADPVITTQPANASICVGGTQTLSVAATGGTPGLTYQWQSGITNLLFTNISGATSSTYTTPALALTTYYRVVISAAGNGCGSVTSNIATVGVSVCLENCSNGIDDDGDGLVDCADSNCNLGLTVNAGSDVSICNGASTTLLAIGLGGIIPYTYSWSNGLGNGSNKLVSPAVTTTYTVTVTSSSGCTATDQVIVTVNTPPTANAGADVTICAGISTTLTATGGTAYAWSNGLGSGASKIVMPTVTTTYTVTVTNASGCTATDQVIVNVNASPTAGISPNQTICNGTSTTLTASATGGVSPFTYTWSSGLGTGTSKTVTPSASTTYTVTVSGSNGCTSTAQMSVSVSAVPTANAGADATICNGATASLMATGAGAPTPFTYTWSNGSSGASQTVSPASTTTYTVTVTSSNGCFSTDQKIVTVQPCSEICNNGLDDDADGLTDCADSDCGPLANAGSDLSICPGNTAFLSVGVSGGSAPYTYAWNNGLGSGATKLVSPTVNTTYKVTVTSASGCTSTDQVTVTVLPCSENCTNGIDDDNDGLVDCADPDCSGVTAPVLANDDYTTCPGMAYSNRVTYNDGNLNNPVFSIVANPQHGTVTIDWTGKFTYTPNGFECLTDHFTYEVCNQSTGCCDQAVVSITLGDNGVPLLTNVPADLTISCDDAVPPALVVTAFDECPGLFMDFDETSTQNYVGACGSYTITRTWTATDFCGNSVSDEQKINVIDQTKPEVFQVYTMEGGAKLVAGYSQRVTHDWKYIRFPITFKAAPVVLAGIGTNTDLTAVTTQVRNVSMQGFEVRLREEEAQDGTHGNENVSWMAVDADSHNGNLNWEAGTFSNINENIASLNFNQPYSTPPLFFSSFMTNAQSDPATLRHSNLSAAGVQLYAQEEQSADPEVFRVNETIGYLAVNPNSPLIDKDGNAFGETGKLNITNAWATVSLTRKYTKPVVIIGGVTNLDDQPVTIRVRNIGSSKFEVRLQEWNYQDGNHLAEGISWMVVEGSVPANQNFYCSGKDDALRPNINIFAVDNCDDLVSFGYDENSNQEESGLVSSHTWTAIDDCGNTTLISRFDTCQVAALQVKALLYGAITGNGGGTLMRDNLRTKKVVPLVEPYTGMPGLPYVDYDIHEQSNHDDNDNSNEVMVTICHLTGTPQQTTLSVKQSELAYYLSLGDNVGACGTNMACTVTVCHKPGTAAQKTLDIPQSALLAHLAHGDLVGGCTGTGNELSNAASNADYRTIADGDWSDAAVWQGGIKPTANNINNKTVSIEHNITLQNSTLKLKGNSKLYVTGGSLTMLTDNFIIDDGSANFERSTFKGATTGGIQLTKNASRLTFNDCVVKIGQGIYNNGGGKIKMDHVSLEIGEAYNNSMGTDSLINVCAVIMGNVNNTSGGKIYLKNTNLRLPLGSVNNQLLCTISGSNNKLLVESGAVNNLGIWTALLDQYCLAAGLLNIPTTFLPAIADCSNISNVFSPCDCYETGGGTSNSGGGNTGIVNNNGYTINDGNSYGDGAIEPTLMDVSGDEAVVDWLLVELRNMSNSAEVLGYQSVVLRRDGDIVSEAGDSILVFPGLDEGDYYVAIRHRNHLGQMTDTPYFLSVMDPPLVDFTDPNMPIKGGSNAGKIAGGKRSLWGGDYNGDGKVIYQGPNNDIFYLFSRVLGDETNETGLANYIVPGYEMHDFNLDGQVIYQGPSNDRASLLYNTILTNNGNPTLLANYIALDHIP